MTEKTEVSGFRRFLFGLRFPVVGPRFQKYGSRCLRLLASSACRSATS